MVDIMLLYTIIHQFGPAGIVGGGEWMYSTVSTFNTTTEVPLSKNPQLLPGRRSIGCPLLRVCVRGVWVCSLLCVCTLDGLNAEHEFRVWVTILGRMSRHFIITLIRDGNLFRSNSSSINDSYSTLKDSIFKQKINLINEMQFQMRLI